MANLLWAISNVPRSGDVRAADTAPEPAKVGQRAAGQQAAPVPEPDRADLSGAGQILGNALKALSATSPVRHELVAELKARIAAGNYQPDPALVASAVAGALREGKP